MKKRTIRRTFGHRAVASTSRGLLAVLMLALALVQVAGRATPATAAPGDPFPVGSAPAVFISQGSPTSLYRAVTGGTGATTFVLEGGPQAGVEYNALAYNPGDRYLYAVVRVAGTGFPVGSVIRIGQGNVFTRVGTGLANTPSAPISGTIDPATGTYYIISQTSNVLRTVDLATGTQTSTTTLSSTENIPDVTFKDGYLWAVDGARTGDLVRINPATGAVTRINANLAIPAGDYGAAWTYGNGNLGFSNNGNGRIVQISVTNPSAATPTLKLVRINDGPTNNVNDGASILGGPVDLSIDKTGPATYTSAGSLTYNLTVTNTSANQSSGWSVTDTLPAGVAFVSAAPSTGTCSQASGVITCIGGVLDAGATVTIPITVTAPNVSAGCITNIANVFGNETDPTSANDQDDATTCPQTAGISLDKTADRTSVTAVGQQITYTMVATNQGNVPLTNVTITDPHAGLSALSCTPALGSTLAPDATMTCTGTYAATAADLASGSHHQHRHHARHPSERSGGHRHGQRRRPGVDPEARQGLLPVHGRHRPDLDADLHRHQLGGSPGTDRLVVHRCAAHQPRSGVACQRRRHLCAARRERVHRRRSGGSHHHRRGRRRPARRRCLVHHHPERDLLAGGDLHQRRLEHHRHQWTRPSR